MQNKYFVNEFYGLCKHVAFDLSDTAQQLSAAQRTLSDTGKENSGLEALFITVESTNGGNTKDGLRFTIDGTTPTNGANPVGHLISVGQTIKITGKENIKRLKMLNGSNSSANPSRVQISIQFESFE